MSYFEPAGVITGTFAFVSHLYCAGTTLYVLHKQPVPDQQQLVHRNRHVKIVRALAALGIVNFAVFAVRSTRGFDMILSVIQDTAGFLTSVIAQSYLLHRTHILFGRRRPILIGLLVALFLVLGFGATNLAFQSSARFPVSPQWLFTGPGPAYMIINTLPLIYWVLALCFNIGLNALIIFRLLRMRSRVRVALGEEYSKTYTGIVAMLLESSLLYTIVLVVGYWALPEGGTYNLFSPLVAQTEGIASELIILRFALGRSLSKSTIRVATTVKPDMEAQVNALEQLHAQVLPQPTSSTQFTQIYPSSVAAVLLSHHQPEPVVVLNRKTEWQKAEVESRSSFER